MNDLKVRDIAKIIACAFSPKIDDAIPEVDIAELQRKIRYFDEHHLLGEIERAPGRKTTKYFSRDAVYRAAVMTKSALSGVQLQQLFGPLGAIEKQSEMWREASQGTNRDDHIILFVPFDVDDGNTTQAELIPSNGLQSKFSTCVYDTVFIQRIDLICRQIDMTDFQEALSWREC